MGSHLEEPVPPHRHQTVNVPQLVQGEALHDLAGVVLWTKQAIYCLFIKSCISLVKRALEID